MTNEERIIYFYRLGKSITFIRRITGHSFDKVDQTIKYFLQFGKAPVAPKKGRPTNLTNQALSMITMLTVQNRMSSCHAISMKLQQNGIHGCSATTVWRGRRDLQFNFKPPKHRQFLTLQQKEQRKIFANSLLCSDFDYERIIFSDESRFCMGPDNTYRWYKRGESTPNCFDDSLKYDVSIMIYGAIGIGYKSKLVFCSGGVDNIEYRNIINESGMLPTLDSRYGVGNYTFMQDGAPAHRCKLTSLFLQKRCSFISSWPSNSPDLNPIEHLWGAMKRILKTKQISSKQQLIDTVTEIWDSFPQESIDNLVRSFKGRLHTVIQQNGESISDILRSGIDDLPEVDVAPDESTMDLSDMITTYDPSVDDNPIEVRTQRKWELEDDIILLTAVKELGKKWSLISKRLTDRTANSCRQRFNHISK